GKGVRDGDVKRRMLEISRDFDEGKLGFPKFTRFLRHAHDAEVIDLTRAAAGNYEVSLPASGRKLPPPKLSAPAPASAEERETAAAPASASARAATDDSAEAPAASRAATPSTAPAPKVGALRGRRGGRGAAEGPPPILPGQAV